MSRTKLLVRLVSTLNEIVMIKQFEHLTEEERAMLYKAPVLVSVLAACSYKEINPAKKKDAIRLAHLKTFTAVPLLKPYYTEVEKTFADEFEKTATEYYPFDEQRRAALQAELYKVDGLMHKLDKNFAEALQKSLQRYATHVKRSTHSVFQDFIFPLYIPGLSE